MATRLSIQPSAAWTFVFIPALCFFLATRMSQTGFRFGRSYSLGQLVQNRFKVVVVDNDNPALACTRLSSIFHVSSSSCGGGGTSSSHVELKYGLYLVQSTGLQDVVASIWRHDSELGRGYLLLSETAGAGSIWRWEVGGGPIAIGKTLHLEKSGCRSSLVADCSNGTAAAAGSGGMAIDFYHAAKDPTAATDDGLLVVAEWGEGRIARLEENGARTPIVIQVPDVCHPGSHHVRLQQPAALLYTPCGDLVFTEYYKDCDRAAVLIVRNAVYIPPLASLPESRRAHEWKAIPDDESKFTPVVLMESEGPVGGLALAPSLQHILVTVKRNDSVVLLQVPLSLQDEDPEDEDEEEDVAPSRNRELLETTTTTRQMANLSLHFPGIVQHPGSLAISQQGHVYCAMEHGVAILSPAVGGEMIVLGVLEMTMFPTALTVGGDGFLYVATNDSLLRIAIREQPISIPVDKVRRPSKQG